MKFELIVLRNSIIHICPRQIFIIVLLFSNAIHLSAQTNSDENLEQYLLPGFTRSVVRMKTGISYNAVMNYNTVTEKIVFEHNGIFLDMTDTKSVDTISIQNRKFIPFNEVFYEVLVNAPISLFLQHKSDLIPPGQPSGYGSTSQTSSIKSYSTLSRNGGNYNLKIPSDYEIKPSPIYWIRKNDTMFSFLNKRQFLRIFPEKNDEINKFINQKPLRIENRDDLIKLVNYCNEVIR